jgi:TolB protein
MGLMKRNAVLVWLGSMLAGVLVGVVIGYILSNLLTFRINPPSTNAPRLAYISNGFTHIYDFQNGTDINLGNPDDSDYRTVASPDGKWIASWSHLERARWQLALLSTSTWQRTELKEFEIAFPTISWSPDGQQIAFAASPENESPGFDNSELFLIDIETLETQQLTDNDFRDDAPAFSPDGRRLAFTSAEDGFNRLHILVIATGERHLVTDQAFGYLPAWSPDGQQIAFSSNHEDRSNEIYVIDVTGENLRRITFNTASDEYPFWLP